jgi:hypothetical protein
MDQQPLGLPQGSVRALIALTVVTGTIALLVLERPTPEWLQGGFFTLIGFYFGSRTTVPTSKSASVNEYHTLERQDVLDHSISNIEPS